MKKQFLNIIIIAVDLIFLISLFYISLFVRSNLNGFGIPDFDGLELFDFSFVILIIFLLLYYEGIYNLRYDFWQETYKILKSFLTGFLMVLSLLMLTKMSLEYSRLFITVYFLLGVLFLPIVKRYTKKTIYRFDFFKKRVLVLGCDKEVELFKKEFEKNWYLGQVFDEEAYESVIVSSRNMSIEEINILVEKHLDCNQELYVIPYVTQIDFTHSKIMTYSNIRHNAIEVKNRLLVKRNIWIKNIFDVIIAFMILPFFLIIHLVVSLLIRLDSKGSIWFKQHRLGKDDINFEVYKYRTMYENGDDILKEYLSENPEEKIYYEKYHKYKNDPRVTKIGKFLRATSLDELPQLINVLKGDMSLVGPRPYMLNERAKLGDNKHFVLKVKPGITGLWQVSGRNNLTFKERNELEVWYIKNWSLWADLVILIKTIKVVLCKVGAK